MSCQEIISLPDFAGWHLIGQYDSDVGSWLLHDGGEALLLEIPEGLEVADVHAAVDRLGVRLKYVVASHDHWDHLDQAVWDHLLCAFPDALFIHPESFVGDRLLFLGGEPLWLIKAPKHSLTDVVTIFRGVAMTGDIELGMLESVNDEVPLAVKKRSMSHLETFQECYDYRIHSIVSAHLDDVRTSVNWPDLFREGKP